MDCTFINPILTFLFAVSILLIWIKHSMRPVLITGCIALVRCNFCIVHNNIWRPPHNLFPIKYFRAGDVICYFNDFFHLEALVEVCWSPLVALASWLRTTGLINGEFWHVIREKSDVSSEDHYDIWIKITRSRRRKIKTCTDEFETKSLSHQKW